MAGKSYVCSHIAPESDAMALYGVGQIKFTWQHPVLRIEPIEGVDLCYGLLRSRAFYSFEEECQGKYR